MPRIPALPSALVAILGFIGTYLAAAAPTLPTPWHEIAVAVLAIGTVLGVFGTRTVQTKHATKSYSAGKRDGVSA